MARKQRDYKAEYARAKQRARNAGYQSERQYKRARKAGNVPRNASPISRRAAPQDIQDVATREPILRMSRLRRESLAWSIMHSRRDMSKYHRGMSDHEVELYHAAFVDRYPSLSRRMRARRKREALKAWLVPDHVTPDEWRENYDSTA